VNWQVGAGCVTVAVGPPPKVSVAERSVELNPFDVALTSKLRLPMSYALKWPLIPYEFVPLNLAQPGPSGLKNGGGGGNPTTCQKQSVVVVCTWNVVVPPVTGNVWFAGVTEATQAAVSCVKVMSAWPLTAMTAVRAWPVKFASAKNETNAPSELFDAELALSHGAVLEAEKLDGQEPLAVSGNAPDVATGPLRTFGYGADSVQPCADASRHAHVMQATMTTSPRR
jgi:hypothetical protein